MGFENVWACKWDLVYFLEALALYRVPIVYFPSSFDTTENNIFNSAATTHWYAVLVIY